MNKEASAPSLDGCGRTPTSFRIIECGRRTAISFDDGSILDIGPGLRVVAFLMSRFGQDRSLSDLAVVAALCRDDGTLVHQPDDLLVGLPPDICFDATVDPQAPWSRALQTGLQNVDVVAAVDAWAQRQAIEAVHGGFARLDWGCARRDIDWHGLTFPTGYIAGVRTRLGVLRRSRRALDECRFLLDILTRPDRPGHEPPLAQLLAAVDAEAVRLFAGDVPAVHMPILAARGYRWSPGQHGAPVGFFVDRPKNSARAERRFLARLLGRDEVDLIERSLPASQRYRLP